MERSSRGWLLSGLVVTAAWLAGVGCARAASGDRASGSTDVISRAEIDRTTALNAYDAVRYLRPLFLRSRGRASILLPSEAEPVVYLDDRRMGGVATLREIPANSVFEIRYFSAGQAQMRWGSGHANGAILVVSARSS